MEIALIACPRAPRRETAPAPMTGAEPATGEPAGVWILLTSGALVFARGANVGYDPLPRTAPCSAIARAQSEQETFR